jgi:hypothetical protein
MEQYRRFWDERYERLDTYLRRMKPRETKEEKENGHEE